jgi:hypothetical protein
MLCATSMGDRAGVCLQWECWAGISSAVLEDDPQHIIPMTEQIVGVTASHTDNCVRSPLFIWRLEISSSYDGYSKIISSKTDNLYTLFPPRRTSLPDPLYSTRHLIQTVWANPGWREMQRQRKSFVRVRCQFPLRQFRG